MNRFINRDASFVPGHKLFNTKKFWFEKAVPKLQQRIENLKVSKFTDKALEANINSIKNKELQKIADNRSITLLYETKNDDYNIQRFYFHLKPQNYPVSLAAVDEYMLLCTFSTNQHLQNLKIDLNDKNEKFRKFVIISNLKLKGKLNP